MHGRWTHTRNVPAHKAVNLQWNLVGNQAETKLREGTCGNYTFSARTLIASRDSVDREGGPQGGALIQTVFLLAPSLLVLCVVQHLVVRRPGLPHVISLPRTPPRGPGHRIPAWPPFHCDRESWQ